MNPVCLFILCLASLLAVTAAPARGGQPARELSPEELKSFFDCLVARVMQQYRAPGAVCVVVQGDRVVFAKGFGYADLRTEASIDPESTRFSVGSLSKTVTATAVMQLVERGALSLDGEVARDLPDLAIRNRFGEPVRVRHLLTHTAGFDEQFVGIAARDPRDVPSVMERYARERTFVCEMAPGAFVSYSEQNYLLAGCLVERLTGERFAAAVRRRVLGPAGMYGSDFEAAPLGAPGLVQGYAFDGERYIPMPPLWARTVPGGGLVTTGGDMGRFLLLHLNGGSVNGRQVLRPATVRQMHERQFAHDAQADGMTLGFFRHVIRGRAVVGHSGFSPGTTCELFLLPDEGIGAFIAFNIADTQLAGIAPKAFVAHFFPGNHADSRTIDEAEARGASSALAPTTRGRNAIDPVLVSRLCGSYRNLSYSRRTAEKLSYLWETVSVWDNEDGTLLSNAWGVTEHFAPLEESGRTFRQVDGGGDHTIHFSTDAAGNVTHLLAGTEGFARLRWYENPAAHRAVMRGTALVLAWACFGWPFAHFAARRLGRAQRAGWADRLLWATAALNLAFLIGLRAVHANTPLQEFIYGMPLAMRAILAIPPLGAAMSLLCGALALRALLPRRAERRDFAAALQSEPLLARAHFALVSLAAVGLIPILLYWNLLRS